MLKPTHLGDGAYISQDERGLVLTANHHHPAMATDVVVLDPRAVAALKVILDDIEVTKEPTGQ